MQQTSVPGRPASLLRGILNKRLKPLLPVVFLLTAAGCHSAKDKKPKQDKGPMGLRAEAIVVKPAELNAIYESSGNLLANEAINVYPEVSGRITAIHFREGVPVRKGDLLIQLFDGDIRAQIQKLKVQRQLLVITRERQDELLAINGISKQEYDNTVAQIASIDADVEYNEAQLRRLQIRASFDGVIGLRNVSVGAVVTPTTLITIIQQVNPLKLDFPIPEQYKGVIRNGDAVRFTVTGSRDTMSGQIAAIQPGADATTRTIMMRALVPNPANKLVPGAFANVYLTLNRNSNAIMIPSQSIIPTTRDKKVAVLRNGKAELVTVATGLREVEDVEILHGLQPGDTVLTTGIMQVKPGVEVKVTKIRAYPIR
ncbi:efflux RND transporter periplasmic adaptor subunit [Taibaiella helva]|uniref:efflux RND transporter periplasmic adaptor subunit n=1 Tax=Taibaiella helva TaxID=2301235 RepID=UPI000E596F71|nr:efflux RND transporter periplasmic adaptor subunit [Taibaiella helva]